MRKIVLAAAASGAAAVFLTACQQKPEAVGVSVPASPAAVTSSTPAPTSAATTTAAPVEHSKPAQTPAASATMGASSPAAKPSATSAPAGTSGYGVSDESRLTPSGSITAKSGQVIENLDIAGRVLIGDGVHDVVIRNCRFTGDGTVPWGIDTEGDGSVSADHVTIRGDYTDAGIGYHNVTVSHADIYGMTNDGAKVGNNFSITDSWIHDFTPATGAHADGLQIMERVANVLIQGNVIQPGLGGQWSKNTAADRSVNSAMILNDSIDRGTAGRIVVDRNQLGGGGYTVYFGVPGDTQFTNNRFVRNSYLWGPVEPSAKADIWSGNSFTDNGAEVLP
ncbi:MULTISPECIES: right-handed parallel beta-helix repeat-containing protein [unclassified Amycolatopsis]|uniref:right-handed parallel beta-helix repeat-containing protein n=1 Tax=unclassified Amycolatopsis TaxID=2618356 RepID=UPI00106E4815|nr:MULTISPECIES: right-handed parallel beta-helix repeat-containing protein [unclassified Amycolatopsis]